MDRNVFKTRENNIEPQKKKKRPSKAEISNLPDKVMITKMLTELGRRVDKHSENFNKERENVKKKKHQTEVTNKAEE